MEEQQENLLRQLETEGQQIAKYRKLMLDLARSGKRLIVPECCTSAGN